MNAVTITEIRTAFNLKSANSKRSKSQWQDIFFADVMDIRIKNGFNRRAGEMLYGITWAYKTGRLTASTETALRGMSAYKFAALLADVTVKCAVINDVPAFLNANI